VGHVCFQLDYLLDLKGCTNVKVMNIQMWFLWLGCRKRIWDDDVEYMPEYKIFSIFTTYSLKWNLYFLIMLFLSEVNFLLSKKKSCNFSEFFMRILALRKKHSQSLLRECNFSNWWVMKKWHAWYFNYINLLASNIFKVPYLCL